MGNVRTETLDKTVVQDGRIDHVNRQENAKQRAEDVRVRQIEVSAPFATVRGRGKAEDLHDGEKGKVVAEGEPEASPKARLETRVVPVAAPQPFGRHTRSAFEVAVVAKRDVP